MRHWTSNLSDIFPRANGEKQSMVVTGFWEFCIFEFVNILLNYRGLSARIREI